MDGKLQRAGALALLLTLLGGCTTQSTLVVRTNVPVFVPLAEATARAHSNIMCSNADVEERSAHVVAQEVRNYNGTRTGGAYSAYAKNRCTHSW